MMGSDEGLRIAYWRYSMERGRRFMDLMMDYPVRESGERLASIEDAARHGGVEMAFSATPIVENIPRVFEVREGLIEPLIAAAREMNERGWVLKIEDGFRTVEAQRKLAHKPSVFDVILRKTAWETGSDEPDLELVMRRVSTLIANSPKVAGHMSGCAVDISVLNARTGAELDRGGPYLEMSEITPMASPFVSPEAAQLRALITAIMERHGFAAYPFEFWHYSQGDVFAQHLRCTGEPGWYAAVHRDPSARTVEPLDDLAVLLNEAADLREEISKARARMQRNYGC
jgi:D-alanyl-D-alanine dipeptidase